MVQVVHAAVKGRTRFKVEGLYRSEILKQEIESKLSSEKGIERCFANPLTGKVLVLYNSDNTPNDLVSFIAEVVSSYKKKYGSPQPPAAFSEQRTYSQNNIHGDRPLTGVNLPLVAPLARIKDVAPKSRRKLRQSIIQSEDQRVEQWHRMEETDIVRSFGTSRISGLSSDLVGTNLKKYGPNVLPEAVPRSGLSIFINQFKSLPVALLGAAAGVSIITGGLVDAVVIAGVVLINAAIGYTTESQTEKTINSLKSLVRPIATAIRDRVPIQISAGDLVPGDLIILRPGSYVPADARLVETKYLSIDESALTGESMPVMKTLLPISETDIPLGDRTNMVYMGTLVTGGQGLAVVVATGKFTEIGKIQILVGEATAPETPMERQLDRMGTQLVFICSGVCGIVFFIGLLRGYGFLQMLKTSISLAVAAVPEGLPAVATTTLALGIRRMKKLNVLIRHLEAVETLGSIQTICLDKTGTITMNRMSTVALYTEMQRLRISEGKFIGKDGPVNPYSSEELLKLIHISVLCNESEISMEEGKHVLRGSPTENSLVQMALSAGVDVLGLKEKYPLRNITHRSEERNFMSTEHSLPNHGRIVALKGSPSEVLSLCKWRINSGNKLPLTDDDRTAIETENERMAGEALRVLGMAYSFEEDSGIALQEYKPDGFIWLGLIGMADPVRKGVKDLISLFHQAGIDTVMITGDQSPTAYAIGKELDLSKGGQLEILNSSHLADLDPEVMKALCERVHVFSRVSPAHKLQIVQALQQAGKIVAMTGDGINDGPALKAANIGIAMGHTGTDVAREVADVILEDDNLQTMIIAISQGRTIYNNIRKSVHFLLSTNLSEIMVMFAAIAGGLGQPLSAIQLLWINLISDIFPGLALALEPPEPDVLTQSPRNPDVPIVKTSDFKRIAFESGILSAGALGAYGYGIAKYGIGQKASTMAFLSLTTGQLLHAVSCRSEVHSIFSSEKLPPNRYLNMALGGSFAVQLLAMVVPGLRSLLGIAPISIFDGFVIGGSALVPLLVNESTKKIPKRSNI
ncbi:MAG: HAD-IC family P-type ATPase [Dissulfurispiraceae bacterium]